MAISLRREGSRYNANYGAVGLPWPVGRRLSWEKFALHRPRPQISARRRGPSRDRVDTSRDSRGRTFSRVKRQLETQSRARRREHSFNRSRRRPRRRSHTRRFLPSTFRLRSVLSVIVRLASALSVRIRNSTERSVYRSELLRDSLLKPTAFTHEAYRKRRVPFLFPLVLLSTNSTTSLA